jgi:hypothetical protein
VLNNLTAMAAGIDVGQRSKLIVAVTAATMKRVLP